MQVLGIEHTKHVRSHLYLFETLGEIHIHLSYKRISSKSHKIHFSATTQPLFPSLDSHFSPVRISTLLFLFLSCCILSSGRRAYYTIIGYQLSLTTRVTHVSRGTSASVEFQRQEVLSLQDALCCSNHGSIRWRQLKNYTLRANSFGRSYKNQNFFLVRE
jgi:hypothetical protein